MTNRFRLEQYVAAHRTHVCRNVVNHKQASLTSHSVRYTTLFIVAGTISHRALHDPYLALLVGVTHFGVFGSYTVMMISTE